MNPLYEFEDIDDYIHDRMSVSDRVAFEDALQSDADLARRVEALRSESKVLRMLRNEHLLAQLDDWSNEVEAEKKTDTPSNGRKGSFLYRNWRIVAFMFVLAGGLIVLVLNLELFGPDKVVDPVLKAPSSKKDTASTAPVIQKPLIAEEKAPPVQTPKVKKPKIQKPKVQKPKIDQDIAAIADNSYMEGDFSETLMGAAGEESQLLYDQALRLYENDKYRDALKLLEKPDKNREQESLYLRGYTYYHLGQYAKAEADFHKFRDLDSDRKLDALWCEVFCMTKQLPGSRTRLDTLLKEITANPKHPYFDRAKTLELALQKK